MGVLQVNQAFLGDLKKEYELKEGWATKKYNSLYLEFRTQPRHLIPASFK
jgi:hypothetical protein